VLESGSSSPGLSPGQGHSVVFLGEKCYSHKSASLDPGVKGYWQVLHWGVTCHVVASHLG